MQTLFICFGQDSMYQSHKSVGIRLCYLFSTQFRIAGSLHHFFSSEDELKKMKLDDQIEFIIVHGNKLESGMIDLVKQFKKLHREAKKITRPTREMILSQRQNIASMKQLFDSVAFEFLKYTRQIGILELKQILNKPTFGYYNIDFDSPEQKLNKEDSLLSDVIKFKLKKEDLLLPTFLFITDALFEDEFTQTLQEAIPVGQYTKQGFLEELIVLPNYLAISIPQLDAVRNSIATPLQQFQQTANNFATMIADTENAFAYLQNEVRHAAEALQLAHNSSSVVQDLSINILEDAINLKLYMGMLSTELVYSCMRYTKTLMPKTEAILAQTKQSAFLPVLVMGKLTFPDRFDAIGDSLKQGEMPLKKSLSID